MLSAPKEHEALISDLAILLDQITGFMDYVWVWAVISILLTTVFLMGYSILHITFHQLMGFLEQERH